MTKTKKSLVYSAISLILCISVLVGTTFAWFTDSVEVTGNIIKAGNLDIEMYWTEKYDGENTVWHNAEDEEYKTIFNYDKWEPGYTDVKYIKIVNEGNLALNYEFAITPETAVGKLAEVIQVYYSKGAVEITQRSQVEDMNSLGFLSNVLDKGSVVKGTLMAEGQVHPNHPVKETVITIAMNMLTSAGNEYQDEESGEFTITALASQAMYEKDSFGDDYDLNAEFPEIITSSSVSVDVVNQNNEVAKAVTDSGDRISLTVPAGVALEDDTDRVTLTVELKDESETGIVPLENELFLPYDVHPYGVSENNDVPLIINFNGALPKYLNMGNYTLIHVEDGVNVPMTMVSDAAQLTAHNTFTYDPDTGSITVAMASFSEVGALINTENPWGGKYASVDKVFSGSGTQDDPYIISSADELAGLGELISYDEDNGTSWGAKHYKLIRDINIKENIWYPIGYRHKGEGVNAAGETIWYEYGGAFTGVFDGNGHTITGIRANTWAMDGDYDYGYWDAAMGLFGYVYGGTVKNLHMDNFESDGEFTVTGCVSAYAGSNATFENIVVTNSNPRTYNTGVACIVGYDGKDGANLTFKNITIDDSNKVSALWGSWDVGVAGILGALRENSKANFENCYVYATMDANNDVCGNYQYYWYRYTGAFIGTVRRSIGNKVDLANVTAENCYADFGDRHEYYYCELVANSKASYTHDHQMSRLAEISSLSDIQDADGNWTTTGNFIVKGEPTECYHIMRDSEGTLYRHFHDAEGMETVNGVEVLVEDKQLVHIPYRQLFGGYGWGMDGYDLGEEGVTGIIRIKDVTTATEKFKSNVGPFEVFENGEVSVKNIFSAVKDANINMSNVQVTISPVADSNVTGTYNQNVNEWSLSTITLSGEGYAQIIINDYTMCKPVSVTIKVVTEIESGGDNGGDDGSGDASDW